MTQCRVGGVKVTPRKFSEATQALDAEDPGGGDGDDNARDVRHFRY